jgi:cell shape-determining protein MreC
MKMSYRPDKSLSNRHPGWRISARRVWFLVVLFVVALFGAPWLRLGLESPILKLSYPLLAFQRALAGSTLSWSEYLNQQKTLVKNNQALREENKSLKLTILANQQAADDYRHLRATLGERELAAKNLVARVIATPSRSAFDTLLLDLGRDNTTKPLGPGLLVGSGEVLLGQLVSVDKQISKVKMFSSAGEKTAVVIGPSKVPAELLGRGGGNFAAFLPRGVTVASGDLATVPMYGGRLLAVVGSVDNNPEEPFQTIYLRSPINLFTLSWLELYVH